MAKQVIQDNVWAERLPASNRHFNEWEKHFRCETLEKYYEGEQWAYQQDYNPYTINKVMETIAIKIAQFCPTFPKYEITATPGNADFNLEEAALSANLKQDVLNTLIQNPKANFASECELAYRDSFFYFGLMEYGYSADWIMNPNANRYTLQKDVDKDSVNGDKVKTQPTELPAHERVFFKRVNPKRFRIGGSDRTYLHQCGWVGYFDWMDKDEILAYKILNRSKVEEAKGISSIDNHDPDRRHTNQVKIWRIWDLKTHLQLLILDDPCVTIYQRKFKNLPLVDYRPDKRLLTESFFPIPPVFHWLSPQDEINETREMVRAHRRRFVRKYQVVEGGIDDVELQKFETGDDGSMIKVKRENAITAIDAPNLGASLNDSMLVAPDDFNRVTGTSSEIRGTADRTTATQAQIINQRAGVREQKERDRLVTMFEALGRGALLVARDNFALGVWVQLTADPGQMLQEMQEMQPTYQFVTTEDLNDGYDFKIEIDVTSISTSAQVEEEAKFLKFLNLTSQYPQIALSPLLIRETAYRVGYRNEKIIREMQKMALLTQMGHTLNLQQQGVALPMPGQAQQGVQRITPNTNEKIRNQLQEQVVQ